MIIDYVCVRDDKELLNLSKLKFKLKKNEIKFIEITSRCGSTLYFSFLRKYKNKIVELVYAAKVYKCKLYYQEVLRRIEGNSFILTKNIYYGKLCGYRVVWDFSSHVGYYYDKDYMFDKWFIEYNSYHLPVFLNYTVFDLISLDSSLKYCSWNGVYSIIVYISIYRKYPKLEILSKLDYLKFADSIIFLRKLEDNKFLKFLHKNRFSIHKVDLNVRSILKAYKLGYTLDQFANEVIFSSGNDNFVNYDDKLKEVAKKYSFLLRDYPNYKMVFPLCSSDFVREGIVLKHCVGRAHYDRKMAHEECLIIFIRSISAIDIPLYTMEYDINNNMIRQFYGFRNTVPPVDVVNLFNNWLFDISTLSEV